MAGVIKGTELKGKVVRVPGAEIGAALGNLAGSGRGDDTAPGPCDDQHEVCSISKAGDPQLHGDVTLTGTGGIALNQVGQNIAVDGSGIVAVTNGNREFVAGVGSFTVNEFGSGLDLAGLQGLGSPIVYDYPSDGSNSAYWVFMVPENYGGSLEIRMHMIGIKF